MKFFLSLFLLFSACAQKNKSIKATHKIKKQVSIVFTDSDHIQFDNKSTSLHSFELKVLHVEGKIKKTILSKSLSIRSSTVLIPKDSIQTGMLVAVMKYKDAQNNIFTSSTTYRLEDQEEINKSKQRISSKNR